MSLVPIKDTEVKMMETEGVLIIGPVLYRRAWWNDIACCVLDEPFVNAWSDSLKNEFFIYLFIYSFVNHSITEKSLGCSAR